MGVLVPRDHGGRGERRWREDLPAATFEPRRDWAWQRFSLPWQPAERGEVHICVRALEAAGATQPLHGARNAIHAVAVVVR
jgi:hypothetical protein